MDVYIAFLTIYMFTLILWSERKICYSIVYKSNIRIILCFLYYVNALNKLRQTSLHSLKGTHLSKKKKLICVAN